MDNNGQQWATIRGATCIFDAVLRPQNQPQSKKLPHICFYSPVATFLLPLCHQRCRVLTRKCRVLTRKCTPTVSFHRVPAFTTKPISHSLHPRNGVSKKPNQALALLVMLAWLTIASIASKYTFASAQLTMIVHLHLLSSSQHS